MSDTGENHPIREPDTVNKRIPVSSKHNRKYISSTRHPYGLIDLLIILQLRPSGCNTKPSSHAHIKLPLVFKQC